MFEWFTGERDKGLKGLERMRAQFGQMLDAGRHIFDAAANSLLGGTELEVIRQDLFETDKRINDAEQRIRREIVIHATVHGAASFPSCLVLMTVVKDAERVGDYAKNIFDLAELSPEQPSGEYKDDLIRLKDEISTLMGDCREAFDAQDNELAKQLIRDAQRIEDHCDEKVSLLIKAEKDIDMSTTYALAYRYFKRVASHVFNVATSVFQPIDKIDFKDEPHTEEA